MDRSQIAIEFVKSLKGNEIEKIILFGSVARGEDNNDSYMDILIITSDKSNISKETYSKVSDFILKTGKYLSVKTYSY
ncbi:MAG: nucleotidyltransferase domain-containing protein [Methanobrevibacter sp. CfCl-M3]